LRNAIWGPLWDVVFSASSLLLSVFFGVALANVVREVPLDATGYFFEPLWTDFRVGDKTGILDWYTLLVGLLALAFLAMHGGLWLRLKTNGSVGERSRKLSGSAWWAVAALGILATATSFRVQPSIAKNFATRPWGLVFPAIAIVGLIAVKLAIASNRELRAFLFSSICLAGMMAAAVFGIYPMVLPGRNAAYSLTVQSARAGS